MHVYTLQMEQVVRRPLGEVFSFFSRPENLEKLTPKQLRFRILTPSPIPMRAGTLVDYEIRVWGIPLHWRTLISEFEPPCTFVDQQILGPYAFWHHRHTFKPVDAGTLICDTVHYALPMGPLGRFVHAFYVRHDLSRIFAYRKQSIMALFGGNWRDLYPSTNCASARTPSR